MLHSEFSQKHYSQQVMLYTPLSQNMTDSDSEEEIHSSATIALGKSSTKVNQQKYSYKNMNVNNNNNNNNNYYNKINNMNYQQQQHIKTMLSSTNSSNLFDNNVINDDTTNKLQINDIDNIAILNNNNNNINNNQHQQQHQQKQLSKKEMSMLRKFLFIASILLCFIVIIVFLWIIPCSDKLKCPAKVEQLQTHNWLREYSNIELKGTINIVNGLYGHGKNLIFMYRGDKLFPSSINNKTNGIISIISNLGQIGWYVEMHNEPYFIDCTLIDADHNNLSDCIIIDEYGEIDCIDPISGQWLWRISDQTTTNSNYLTFPLILPDLNEDGCNDLLVASSLKRHLQLISGSNGKQIGRNFKINDCLYVHKFQINEQLQISYNCVGNNTERQIIKNLNDLYQLITNQSLNIKTLKSINSKSIKSSATSTTKPIIQKQHKFFGQRKDTVQQRNIYNNNNKKLIIENIGKCPDNCTVIITLTDEMGKEHINFTSTKMYGMVPALILLNNTLETNSQTSQIYGYIIKLWEWIDTDNSNKKNINKNINNNTKKNNNNNSNTNNINNTNNNNNKFNKSDNLTTITKKNRVQRNSIFNSNNDNDDGKDFNKFSNILIKKKTWKLFTEKRYKRSKNITNDDILINSRYQQQNHFNNHNNKFKNDHLNMRTIRETIILILFNSTDIRIENTSQSNIIQFCRNDYDDNDNDDNNDNGKKLKNKQQQLCQPDLNYQENSLIINDLDDDDSQELISYYSTYIKNDENINDHNSGVKKNDNNEWKLLTYVQVLRFESELPKLNDIDSRTTTIDD